jgi:ABC-type transport system involved in multi-copper enzyme maturation permease subunit
MIWLTIRQLRLQATAVYSALAAALVVLLVTGQRLADLAKADTNIFDHLTTSDRTLFYAGTIVIAVVPALVGAFWGGPLVARELEMGTQRLIWSQSVTRARWLAIKLGLTSLVGMLAVGALSAAVTWWAHPLDGALSSTHGGLPSRLTPVTFAMRGIVPVAYTAFAVTLGVALGCLVRRSTLAIAMTLVVYTFVQIAMPLWVRPHLISPVSRVVEISPTGLDGIESHDPAGSDLHLTMRLPDSNDWSLTNETVDSHGDPAALPSWFSACMPRPDQPSGGSVKQSGSRSTLDGCLSRLHAEGYQQHLVYQPVGRFWAFQWIETGLFLAVSGGLVWFSFWWVRRRLA